MRVETDLIGTKEIEKDAYYGLQTLRAYENFNITGIYPFSGGGKKSCGDYQLPNRRIVGGEKECDRPGLRRDFGGKAA